MSHSPLHLLNECCYLFLSHPHRDDPYDEVIFPQDPNVAAEHPDFTHYEFNSGLENVIDSLLERVDPFNENLRAKCVVWFDLSTIINQGFTALGISRAIPSFLHFLLRKDIQNLYKLASYTVRDVQYAVFNEGYSIEDLLKDCPKAPPGNEPDPVLRRAKGVLNHPIGDYGVQVSHVTQSTSSFY